MSESPLPCDNRSIPIDEELVHRISLFARFPLDAVAALDGRTQTLAAVIHFAGGISGECFAARERIAEEANLSINTVSKHLQCLTPIYLTNCGRQRRRPVTYRVTEETRRLWRCSKYVLLPLNEVNIGMSWGERIVFAVIVSENVMRNTHVIKIKRKNICQRSAVSCKTVKRALQSLHDSGLIDGTLKGVETLTIRVACIENALVQIHHRGRTIRPSASGQKDDCPPDKSTIAVSKNSRMRSFEKEPVKKNAAVAAMRGLKDSDFESCLNAFLWLDRWVGRESVSELRQIEFVALWVYVWLRSDPKQTTKNRLERPAGAFIAFLQRERWDRISQADEDKARRIIQQKNGRDLRPFEDSAYSEQHRNSEPAALGDVLDLVDWS